MGKPSEESVFVFLSEAIEEVLEDHGTNLEELLRHEGLNVEVALATNPAEHGDSRAKEPVTVLLASAAVIASVTPVITRAIQALAHRSVVVEEEVLVPVESSGGEVVRDARGEPILHWTRRARALSSAPEVPDETEISIQGPLGLSIDYRESGVSGADA